MLVGEQEHRFQVHKDTICEKSKFFEAAVSSDRWREGKEKLVRLPDISPDIFRCYVHWVYTGHLLPGVHFEDTELDESHEQTTYIAAYIVADILDDFKLRTHVIEHLIAGVSSWSTVPGGNWCSEIWAETPKGSPLRVFLVEWTYSSLEAGCFSKDVSHWPKEFLEELAMLAMKENTVRGLSKHSLKKRLRAKLLAEQKGTKS